MSCECASPTPAIASSISAPGNLIVLLHAFEKDTGAVPTAEKTLAKRRMVDFKRRMDAKPRVPPRAAGRDAPPGSRGRG